MSLASPGALTMSSLRRFPARSPSAASSTLRNEPRDSMPRQAWGKVRGELRHFRNSKNNSKSNRTNLMIGCAGNAIDPTVSCQ